MMRKNKFVNPFQKVSDILERSPSPNHKERNHPLIQNKIYFPASYEDKLMPYKIASSYHKKNANLGEAKSTQLYDIKETKRSKESRQRKPSFGRENKFEKAESQNKQNITSKGLTKYDTIELKNLPGISYTSSGTTIYRSKNLKSSSKVTIQHSIAKRNKSQLRQNISVFNEESIDSIIPKDKINKQINSRLKDKNFLLYETYFSSKSGLNFRSNSCRPFQHADFIQQEIEEKTENPEDALFQKIVQTELYGDCDKFQQQQQFF